MESDAALQKNPLLVDLKTAGKQSTTKAWFSKVDETLLIVC